MIFTVFLQKIPKKNEFKIKQLKIQMNSVIKQIIQSVKQVKTISQQFASNSKEMIYITDYLNIWSDYREIKYKMSNVDFHSIKHKNKEIDTFEFFDLFFTKYITYKNISIKSNFIFILKKITKYDLILVKILKKYHNINIRFIVIESKYNELLLDKNKDDFLCQYLFCFLMKTNDNCILISNDKYRDLPSYVDKYSKISITILTKIESQKNELNINIKILDLMNNQNYKRCTIPKNKLQNIIP